MKGYELFAPFYDKLTYNVDYKGIAEFFDTIIKKEGNGGKLVLDLACGTGSLSLVLAEFGYDVIGTDSSVQMLSCAMSKPHSFDNPIFLNQSMQDLDLFGTIDAAICCLDSINHLETKEDVEKAIQKVSLFLNDGGIFIFDVNTLYKHKEILADNTYIYDTDKVYCAWQNHFCEKNGSVEITLDFFESQTDGSYERFYESFTEQHYSDELLTEILNNNCFNVISRFDDFNFKEINEKTQRIVYVCRKENK